MIRFSQTVLEKGRGRLRLLDATGQPLLELAGVQIDDAIRSGYLDPENPHYSLFEYWRIRFETRAHTLVSEADASDAVQDLLESLDVRPFDDDGRSVA